MPSGEIIYGESIQNPDTQIAEIFNRVGNDAFSVRDGIVYEDGSKLINIDVNIDGHPLPEQSIPFSGDLYNFACLLNENLANKSVAAGISSEYEAIATSLFNETAQVIKETEGIDTLNIFDRTSDGSRLEACVQNFEPVLEFSPNGYIFTMGECSFEYDGGYEEMINGIDDFIKNSSLHADTLDKLRQDRNNLVNELKNIREEAGLSFPREKFELDEEAEINRMREIVNGGTQLNNYNERNEAHRDESVVESAVPKNVVENAIIASTSEIAEIPKEDSRAVSVPVASDYDERDTQASPFDDKDMYSDKINTSRNLVARVTISGGYDIFDKRVSFNLSFNFDGTAKDYANVLRSQAEKFKDPSDSILKQFMLSYNCSAEKANECIQNFAGTILEYADSVENNSKMKLSNEVVSAIDNSELVRDNIHFNNSGEFIVDWHNSSSGGNFAITFDGTDEGLRDAITAEIERVSDPNYINSVIDTPEYVADFRARGQAPMTYDQFKQQIESYTTELSQLRDQVDQGIENRDLRQELDTLKERADERNSEHKQQHEKKEPVKAGKNNNEPEL